MLGLSCYFIVRQADVFKSELDFPLNIDDF